MYLKRIEIQFIVAIIISISYIILSTPKIFDNDKCQCLRSVGFSFLSSYTPQKCWICCKKSVGCVSELRFLFSYYGHEKRVSDMCPRNVGVQHVSGKDTSPSFKQPFFFRAYKVGKKASLGRTVDQNQIFNLIIIA